MIDSEANMARWTKEQIERAFKHSQGKCNQCGWPLVFAAYGRTGHRDEWHIEHSRPRARGGTDHGNNLYGAHAECNIKKGAGSNSKVRREYGLTRAPLSENEESKRRRNQAVQGGLLGFVAATALDVVTPGAGLIGGAIIGALIEPNEKPTRRRRSRR